MFRGASSFSAAAFSVAAPCAYASALLGDCVAGAAVAHRQHELVRAAPAAAAEPLGSGTLMGVLRPVAHTTGAPTYRKGFKKAIVRLPQQIMSRAGYAEGAPVSAVARGQCRRSPPHSRACATVGGCVASNRDARRRV